MLHIPQPAAMLCYQSARKLSLLESLFAHAFSLITATASETHQHNRFRQAFGPSAFQAMAQRVPSYVPPLKTKSLSCSLRYVALTYPIREWRDDSGPDLHLHRRNLLPFKSSRAWNARTSRDLDGARLPCSQAQVNHASHASHASHVPRRGCPARACRARRLGPDISPHFLTFRHFDIGDSEAEGRIHQDVRSTDGLK